MPSEAGARNADFSEVIHHKQTGSLRLTDGGVAFCPETSAGDDPASHSAWAWSVIRNHVHSANRRKAAKLKLKLDDGTHAVFTFPSSGDMQCAKTHISSHVHENQGRSTELWNDEQPIPVPHTLEVNAEEDAALKTGDESLAVFLEPGTCHREDQADMDAKQAMARHPQEKASLQDDQRVATAAVDPACLLYTSPSPRD
mgnify:CR=1 FL=1